MSIIEFVIYWSYVKVVIIVKIEIKGDTHFQSTYDLSNNERTFQ